MAQQPAYDLEMGPLGADQLAINSGPSHGTSVFQVAMIHVADDPPADDVRQQTQVQDAAAGLIDLASHDPLRLPATGQSARSSAVSTGIAGVGSAPAAVSGWSRWSSAIPSAGQMTTDSSPAATRAAPLARETTPS